MTKKKLKKGIMTGALVVVILIIGYLVYSNFLSSGRGAPGEALEPGMEAMPPEEMEPAMPGEPGLEAPGEPSAPIGPVTSSKLKTDILTDPRFADLKIFGDLPVEVGEVGRDNPFIPFEGYKSGTEEETEEGGEGEAEQLEETETPAESPSEGGEEELPGEEAGLP